MVAGVMKGKLDCCMSMQREGKRSALLTLRQMEVLTQLCRGQTNKEIGIALQMSDNTVRTHVSAIFSLLGVRNRTEAASLAKYLLGFAPIWLMKLAWSHQIIEHAIM
jgi:DNA-binding NarL/FixJ family response regulator